MSSRPNRRRKTPKFCVSLLPKNHTELTNQLSKCQDADIVEVRLDYWKSPDLIDIRQKIDKPVIATARLKEEGGYYSSTVPDLIGMYQKAIDEGIDYIDISYQIADKILSRLKLSNRTKLILSCHLRENDLNFLKQTLNELADMEANVYKLVFEADSINDNLAALDLLEHAKAKGIPFIIHAQGEKGKLSRIIGSFRGNAWTYVALSEDHQTAPGQLSLDKAKYKYFLQEKNSDTKIIGLLGYPVAQSKGWLLFNRLFHLSGKKKSSATMPLNYIYLNFPIRDVFEFWEAWYSHLHGLSVTIPHKETILKYAARQSTEVEKSGVCNTLVKRNNDWEAHNTDLLAIIERLKPHTKQLLNGTVLVYGTGATARSAIVALQTLNVQNILVAGRNKNRAKLLKELFSIGVVEENTMPTNLSAIIQTTPVGMYPKGDSIPKCTDYLKSGMLAFDVVFNPAQTGFLQAAKGKNCKTISGEEMYLHQAAQQFELFTGSRISINDLRKIWNDLDTS